MTHRDAGNADSAGTITEERKLRLERHQQAFLGGTK
jgi:hypothetical protein